MLLAFPESSHNYYIYIVSIVPYCICFFRVFRLLYSCLSNKASASSLPLIDGDTYTAICKFPIPVDILAVLCNLIKKILSLLNEVR